jgi:L-amino acid N-acyltransferase YncA
MERSPYTPRPATLEDREAIARIYNAGIAERAWTFETRPRTPEDISGWLGGRFPVVVVEEAEQVVAFASTGAYSPRECYAAWRTSASTWPPRPGDEAPAARR